MRKNTFTFRHDYGARNDPKIRKVLNKIGPGGGFIFWVVVEMLYEQGGYIPRDSYDEIAHDNYTDTDTVRRVVEEFGLFEFDDEKVWNKVVLEQLTEKKEIQEIHYRPASSPWSEDDIAYLRSLPYNTFLKTRYWRDVSAFVKNERGGVCEICNSTTRVEVHHLSYSHHGDEYHHLDDLICLCHKCHSKVHGYEKQ